MKKLSPLKKSLCSKTLPLPAGMVKWTTRQRGLPVPFVQAKISPGTANLRGEKGYLCREPSSLLEEVHCSPGIRKEEKSRRSGLRKQLTDVLKKHHAEVIECMKNQNNKN